MEHDSKTNQILKLKDGRVVGYAEYGDPKGKPLFFFHGWPGSRFSGAETDEAGKKIGARIISTDRPGMGLSTYKNSRTLLDWPLDIRELADRLHIKKFSVLGVSGGGPYVAACAYAIPERITKAGIVVGLGPVHVKGNLDGMAFQGRIGWANYHRFPLLRTLAAFGAALEFKHFPFLGSFIVFPAKEDRLLYQEALRKQRGKENGAKEAFRQGIKGPREELKIYTGDWGFSLSKISVPVYLWYGAKDRCVSLNMGRYYEAHIPNSTLFIDENGSHLSRHNFEEEILKTLI